MENASKALIIAGSILLAIAIIGIGMYVFTQASDLVDTTKLTAIEIATYNSEFEAYEGNQRGSNIRALLDKVIQHNIANEGDISRQIGVLNNEGGSKPTVFETDNLANVELSKPENIRKIKNSISPGAQNFTVYLIYNKNSGLIVEINLHGIV